MNKFILLFNTIKFLKPIQIRYRLFYFIRSRYRRVIGFKYSHIKESNCTPLKLNKSIENHYSLYSNSEFNFLNLSKKFDNNIDWNDASHGKLWTYNLTYFEYLHKKKDIELVYNFIENIEKIKDGLEPFPISLRGINWIKFLTHHNIQDKKIDNSLYAQYYILMDNLEYHLLGNHLLENGFSLLFGAYYFQDEKLYKRAKEILTSELKEQILEDGGHFELSPMYHQLMLFRVLDCINLIKNNNYHKHELLNFLEEKASVMLGWIENISYKNGDIPLFNDSANKIAPSTRELQEYAHRLKLTTEQKVLSDSGYRKIVKEYYELIIDIGEIKASYIPGHTHADTFNFELRVDGKPFIVDSGLSTYETNKRRFYERSTKAHNTVEIMGENSSEVWGGFRVANRANIIKSTEKENYIKATHNGYKKEHILHTRNWKCEEHKLIIEESLSREENAIFRLHFHPNVKEEQIINTIKNHNYTINSYDYAQEFNRVEKALVLEIEFKQKLKVEIEL